MSLLNSLDLVRAAIIKNVATVRFVTARSATIAMNLDWYQILMLLTVSMLLKIEGSSEIPDFEGFGGYIDVGDGCCHVKSVTIIKSPTSLKPIQTFRII